MLAALLACACAAEPLTFVPESATLNANVRPDARPACDLRLFLICRPDAETTVLNVAAVDLPACVSDQGERLALTWRPEQKPGWRKPERGVVRLPLAVAPPQRPCRTLAAITGSVQVLVARGEAVALEVPLTAKGPAGPEVTVAEIRPRRIVLTLSQRLAQRLAEASAGDARVDVQPQADGTARAVIGADAASCTLRWWPDAETVTIPVAIARIDLPGGIPGSAP